MNPIRAAQQATSGDQTGDPARAAKALLALIAAVDPPTRLFLGENALGLVNQKLDGMKSKLTAWDALSRFTSFAP